MWGSQRLSHHAKSIEKIFWEKINIGKKLLIEKINIDPTNWKKHFDKYTDHK